ncbi:5'-nucleotidase, lipoprotein e(P4) family [Spirosoma sp. KNUC1025]|uniref:5'-nucleotidase, lipoprotein e(P4) family n=1 Tax=Spirosoma sp. KNUC1025 TaxID=2894082 RepID=UPI001E458977|nr:5'-nucleotidase, lipoprotein e(P4) family [Spirosoma sp. KNUC1025]UFH57543.1 5'-nucleotidase, lipoprotein e(P4) family [Spirosoma sp. KNUC1025]
MNKTFLFLLLAGNVAFSAYGQYALPTTVTHKSTSRSITTLDYSLNAVLWQQRSGEYRALCYQAFALAKLQLAETLRQNPKPTKSLAIITDIDESILDNSPQQAQDLLNHTTYSEKSWKAWTAQARAKPLPGAVEFFQYAVQNGVQVFYISNRSQDELPATIQNMLTAGFPQADTRHVIMKGETADKEPRRQAVGQTHEIVMLVGDNLNDFDRMFYKQDADQRCRLVADQHEQFGTRFIILPNAIYGDWESALWNGQVLTPAEADNRKHNALQGYTPSLTADEPTSHK